MNTFESKTEMVQKYKKNASFKCPFCDLTIFGVTKYNLHKKKHNLTSKISQLNSDNIENTIDCKLCPFSCGTLSKLYLHFTKEHSKQDKFKCPKCPSFFKNLNSIKSHMHRNHRSEFSHLVTNKRVHLVSDENIATISSSLENIKEFQKSSSNFETNFFDDSENNSNIKGENSSKTEFVHEIACLILKLKSSHGTKNCN